MCFRRNRSLEDQYVHQARSGGPVWDSQEEARDAFPLDPPGVPPPALLPIARVLACLLRRILVSRCGSAHGTAQDIALRTRLA